MAVIEKKAWPEYFQAILDGDKTFDLRLADFNCKKNDTLVLKEWDPKTNEYTGRIVRKKITYILKTKDIPFFTVDAVNEYGYQVMALGDE